jgi:hypothetical protein
MEVVLTECASPAAGPAGEVVKLNNRSVDMQWARDHSASLFWSVNDGWMWYVVGLSTGLVEAQGAGFARTCFERVSRRLACVQGRTYVDPETFALSPEEVDGPLNGLGWYQFFGATFARRWPETVWGDTRLHRVDRGPDGAIGLSLTDEPLREVPQDVRRAAAEALGIALRRF